MWEFQSDPIILRYSLTELFTTKDNVAMLQTILRLAFYGILPMEEAMGQWRGRGEMYFSKSWPLSFEHQTNPAHFPGIHSTLAQHRSPGWGHNSSLWWELSCSQLLKQGLLSQPGPRQSTLVASALAVPVLAGFGGSASLKGHKQALSQLH